MVMVAKQCEEHNLVMVDISDAHHRTWCPRCES